MSVGHLIWGVSWKGRLVPSNYARQSHFLMCCNQLATTLTSPTPTLLTPAHPTPISKSISSIRRPHLPQICHRSSRNTSPLVDNIVCGKTPLFKQCYQQTKLKMKSCLDTIYTTGTLKTSSPAWLRYMKMNMRPLIVDVGSLTF